jgi:hypothetical protein
MQRVASCRVCKMQYLTITRGNYAFDNVFTHGKPGLNAVRELSDNNTM